MSKLRRPTLALAIVASLSLAACDRPADPCLLYTSDAADDVYQV